VSLVDAALALALEAHAAEEATRVEVQPVVDIRKHLHAKQREVFECDAPAMDVLGGRQGGKTFVDVGWLIEGGLEKPGSINPYFGLTGESVTDIMWPEVETWWQLLGFDLSGLHAHTHTAVMPNGSVVKGRGTDDRRYIESKRGAKYNRIVIDEMGAQPESLIRYFVALLWPTMIRNRGRMLRSGNPGLVEEGYWHERTGPARRVNSPLFHWTAWDNPTLGSAEDVDGFVSAQIFDECGLTLAEIKAQIEEGAKDGPAITFQREWLARWVADAGALVYPYNDERNGVDALPTKNSLGRTIDPDAWRYVIVGDPAGKGTTGISVNAAHPELKYRYVVMSESHVGYLIGQLAQRFRDLRQVYPNSVLMLDAGGLGNVHSQEFTQMFALGTEDAKKTEKPSAVHMFRDEFIAGTIKVLRGQCNDAWRAEASRCGWDMKRLSHHQNAVDHVLDTTLYGHRRLRMWHRPEQEPDGPPQQAIAKALRDRRIAQLRPQPGRERWDR
jgi:hypothetical protein